MCLLGQFESNENTPSRTAIAINPRCVMYRRVAPRHGAAPLGSQDHVNSSLMIDHAEHFRARGKRPPAPLWQNRDGRKG